MDCDGLLLCKDDSYLTSLREYFNNEEELADAVGLTESELFAKVIAYNDYDEDEKINFFDVADFLEQDEDYYKAMKEAAWEFIDDNYGNFQEHAEEILYNIDEQ